jgi:hypothetical protein
MPFAPFKGRADFTSLGLLYGRWTVVCSIPGRGKGVLHSPRSPYRLWAPPSLLSDGWGRFFPGAKADVTWIWPLFPSSSKVKNCEAIHTSIPIRFHRVMLNYLSTGTILLLPRILTWILLSSLCGTELLPSFANVTFPTRLLSCGLWRCGFVDGYQHITITEASPSSGRFIIIIYFNCKWVFTRWQW